jgi:hypothetical protein
MGLRLAQATTVDIQHHVRQPEPDREQEKNED